MALSIFRRHCAVLLAGVGLALAPQVASAYEPDPVEATANLPTTLYVQPDDYHLLYEGQVADRSQIDETPNTNRIERELAGAVDRYRSAWMGLPTFTLDHGSTLEHGDRGARVQALRVRLGLDGDGTFDRDLQDRVRLFRDMHGLPASDSVDNAMITALNRGPSHYLRILETNLFRASELPDYLGGRYVFVDTVTQQLSLIEDDHAAETMRVVVGKANTPTPMMAGLLRHAVLSPYWNVPADLVRDTYASRVVNGGQAYLDRAGFQLLSDFTDTPDVLSPRDVDWRAVRRGDVQLRMRQLPGPGNGMGSVKFMFPNNLGIYLHDTPSTELFAEDERLFSAGCVRVEKPEVLAQWLMDGPLPAPSGDPEEVVRLRNLVPIYVTYFTARADGDRIEFRDDIYGRDTMDAPTLASLR
ncbi:MAG: L,D-transpeptidase family protein [Alteraurantiacibacter sp.]